MNRTPGPWKWAYDDKDGQPYALDGENGEVVLIACWRNDNKADLEIVNESAARLIAKAPELLEALKDVLGYLVLSDTAPEYDAALMCAERAEMLIAEIEGDAVS